MKSVSWTVGSDCSIIHKNRMCAITLLLLKSSWQCKYNLLISESSGLGSAVSCWRVTSNLIPRCKKEHIQLFIMMYYVYWCILYPIYSSIGNLVPMNKYRETTENNLCGPSKEEKGSLLPVNPQNVAATCSLGLSAGSKLGYFSCRNHTFSISCTAWCGWRSNPVAFYIILIHFTSFKGSNMALLSRRPAVTNRSYRILPLPYAWTRPESRPPFHLHLGECSGCSGQTGRHSLANRALGPGCHQHSTAMS